MIVFSALIYHFGDMLFGKKPENMPKVNEQLSIQFAFILLFVIICVTGIFVPGPLNALLTQAAALIRGA